jgi:putative membrane protein
MIHPDAPPSTQPAVATEVSELPVEDWRRLSPRMLLVHPVVESVKALPLVIALLLVGSRNGQGGWWGLVGVGLAVGLGLMRWATTRYRITPQQLEIQRGLFNRRTLTVPRDRVRSVDVTAHVMHRMLGLAKVAVGTGQSDRQKQDGLALDGLSRADANRLHADLLQHRSQVPAPTDSSVPPVAVRETVLAELRARWILYAPFSLSGLVTIAVLLAFVWRTANEAHIDLQHASVVQRLSGQVAALPFLAAVFEVVVAIVLLLAVFSTLAYLLAFWNFRLTRSGSGTLHVRRGLLTTRAITIEERRLRGVELSEPLLLRAVKGARCIAITTGLRVGRGAERGGSVILPPAPRSEAQRVASAVLGETTPLTTALTGHPRAALRRRLVRVVVGLVVLIGLTGVLSWALGEVGWVIGAAIITVPLGLWLGYDRYRSLGHAIVDRKVVFRLGSLVRRRSVLAADGIIGFTIRQSFFQRRNKLVTLTATTAAGRQHYELQDVGAGEAVAIADEIMPGILTPFLVR